MFVYTHVLQIFTKVPFFMMLPGLIISSINITMAYIVYRKKKQGKKANILPWCIGFVSVNAAFMTKVSMVKISWTFALLSTNSSLAMVAFTLMLYLFYQKNLYKFFSILTMVLWICFTYVGYKSGGKFYFTSHVKGVPVVDGIIVSRELFNFFITSLMLLVAYRTIPDIEKFEDKINEQTEQLKKHTETQRSLTATIREKMNILFQKVNGQQELINRFNHKMETQATSFSEMSATMEELAGSAEQIATESITQIEGNVKMESIVEEFKNIQIETKQNLEETYADIQSVSDKSTTANEQLMEVEKTVFAIKEQSNRIGETVNLIVDIADKINLLSLNASIEAARAGEAGRGFAVVADEIGKLAFQTQESIKEINKVLSDNSRNTVDGVSVIQNTAEMMREMIAHMKQGAHKVQLLQESIFIEEKYIKIIIGQMNDNIVLAKKIGTATDEQKVAVESTSQALEDLITILNEMVDEIKNLTNMAHEIYDNASDVMSDSEKAVNG